MVSKLSLSPSPSAKWQATRQQAESKQETGLVKSSMHSILHYSYIVCLTNNSIPTPHVIHTSGHSKANAHANQISLPFLTQHMSQQQSSLSNYCYIMLEYKAVCVSVCVCV